MARLIFNDLTLEQADVLARWFAKSGEQYADLWFEEANIASVYSDKIETIGEDVFIYLTQGETPPPRPPEPIEEKPKTYSLKEGGWS